MFLQFSIQQTGSSSLLFHFSIVTLLLLPKLLLLLWQKSKWNKKKSISKCETILPFETAESVKSYKDHQAILLSLPYPNGKKVSHLQINIFCHFEFCHNKRNGFESICFKCLRMKHCIGLQGMQKKGLYWRIFRIWINSLINTIKSQVLTRLV